MAAKKTSKQASAAENDSAVTGNFTNPQPGVSKKLPLKNKKVLIALALAILLIGGVTAALTAKDESKTANQGQREPAERDQATIDRDVKRAIDSGELANKSRQAIKAGNFGEAERLYEAAVQAESDPARKSQLYIDLSGAYFAEKRYDQAFAAAEKSQGVNDDQFLYADWVSRLYENRGDYAKAVEYYRKAAELAGSPQNLTGLDKAHYEAEVARLEMFAKGGSQQ